ncbi:MAG: FMN-binding protein [Kineosporiaceae bacterium]
MSTISGLVLLFSYHTSRNESSTAIDPSAAASLDGLNGVNGANAADGGSTPDASPTPDDAPAEQPSPTPVASSEPPAPSPTPKANSASKTYLGDAVDTEYGPVQVKITVASGKITKVAVTQVPMSSGHDQRINSYAVPLLNAAAQKWQTSDLQSVSGATITSEAYKRSLQSAIDKAHL